MIHPTYEEMDRLISDAEAAKQYAWDHYDSLASRKAIYTLYGPSSNFLAAASPNSLLKDSCRILTQKTRREKYTVYELDEEYHAIRVIHVRKGGRVDCTYQIFELDGVWYGCPFDGTQKKTYPCNIEVVKFEDNKPLYYSNSNPDCLFLEIYDYLPDGIRQCRQYMYHPHCVQTASYREVPDWNAPYGAPNSPVIFHCIESASLDLDFSKWFEES